MRKLPAIIERMSFDERLLLMQDMWDDMSEQSIQESPFMDGPFTKDQGQELLRRAAAVRAGKAKVMSREEADAFISRHVASRLRKRKPG